MSSKLLSVIGICAAAACLCVATALYPAGFDWNRDFISTMLRGPAGPSRYLADAGAIIFCISIALIFERLGHVVEFGKNAKVIRIAGIGSMVYSSLTITPLHDMMVTVSGAFFLVAALALMRSIYVNQEMRLFTIGCVCLVLLFVSATIYYSRVYFAVLPWAQRVTHVAFAVWLVALDFRFSRTPVGKASRLRP